MDDTLKNILWWILTVVFVGGFIWLCIVEPQIVIFILLILAVVGVVYAFSWWFIELVNKL